MAHPFKSSPAFPLTLLSTAFALFVTWRVFKYVTKLRAVSHLQGIRPPFSHFSPLGFILSGFKRNLGPSPKFVWDQRFSAYNRFETDTFSIVPTLFGGPDIVTSNCDVIRQITMGGHKSDFFKPLYATTPFLVWGMNLFTAEFEVWRKHRRIMGAQFNNKLYKLVWERTWKIFDDMAESEAWTGRKHVDIPVIQHLTSRFGLLVIAHCGFGLPFTWKEPPRSGNTEMSIQEAIRVVSDDMILISLLPKWAWSLPFKRIRRLHTAYTGMMGFLRASIAERRSLVRDTKENGDEDHQDIFTMMVKSNEDNEAKLCLDDDELIGNTYLLLFAGHESTAGSIATTLGLLSVHPDIQNELVEQIREVVGDCDATIDDYPKLDKVLGAFYEAVRMYPAGWFLSRDAQKDTILRVPMRDGQPEVHLPIAKGTRICVDMIGVQYNPRYFDEPHKFKPQRWYASAAALEEDFTAFGLGPRACVGRKFATVEAVSFLTRLLREWRVEPLLTDGQSVDDWKEQYLAHAVQGMALGCPNMPIRLTRRNRYLRTENDQVLPG